MKLIISIFEKNPLPYKYNKENVDDDECLSRASILDL